MRIGAIDIGSNSIRLLVADLDGGSNRVRTVARAGEPCRLARGLDRSGRISAEVADSAATIAAEFVRRARSLGARHIVAGATAALRSAGNGSEVASLIAERAGLRIRILSGEEEARLVYRSVVAGLGGAALRSPCVVFDIGGGSTEVVSGLGLEPGRWMSLPFGAVSLTERFLTTNPPDPEQIEALTRVVNDDVMHHCASMPSETPILAGVGGTMTVLALLDRGLTSYEPSLIEGWVIQHPRLEDLIQRLLGSSREDRRKWPAMGEGRADIVVAGTLVVSVLASRFPSRGLVCSTQGLRYGLARLAAEEAAGNEAAGDDQVRR
jgi:exopolyphosphatase/guanosine-5'-triphosphate,3'-diphosphate pyrophosphatase